MTDAAPDFDAMFADLRRSSLAGGHRFASIPAHRFWEEAHDGSPPPADVGRRGGSAGRCRPGSRPCPRRCGADRLGRLQRPDEPDRAGDAPDGSGIPDHAGHGPGRTRRRPLQAERPQPGQGRGRQGQVRRRHEGHGGHRPQRPAGQGADLSRLPDLLRRDGEGGLRLPLWRRHVPFALYGQPTGRLSGRRARADADRLRRRGRAAGFRHRPHPDADGRHHRHGRGRLGHEPVDRPPHGREEHPRRLGRAGADDPDARGLSGHPAPGRRPEGGARGRDARRRRVASAGRRGLLSLWAEELHHLLDDAGRGASDGAGSGGRNLGPRRRPAEGARVDARHGRPAHRRPRQGSALRLSEHGRSQGRAAEGAERPDGGHAGPHAGLFRPPAQVAVRHSSRAQGHRGRGAGRLLHGACPGWVASGRLLHQSARHGGVAQVDPADPDLSRGRAGSSLPDRPADGAAGHPVADEDPRGRRAGRHSAGLHHRPDAAADPHPARYLGRRHVHDQVAGPQGWGAEPVGLRRTRRRPGRSEDQARPGPSDRGAGEDPPRRRARRGRVAPAGRRGLLRRRAEVEHDDHALGQGDPRHGPRAGGRDHRRDRRHPEVAGHDPGHGRRAGSGPEQGSGATVPQHRRGQGRAAEVAERTGRRAGAETARRLRPPAQDPCRGSPRAGVDPVGRAGRILSGAAAGWLASGRLLHQPALGAVRRGGRGGRSGRLRHRSAGPGGLPDVLSVPGRAPGGRHRHPLRTLEPRTGGRLYGGFGRQAAGRLEQRDQPLLGLAGPGLFLQGRPHGHRAPAQGGGSQARLRPARLPRQGADERLPAAGGAGSPDARLIPPGEDTTRPDPGRSDAAVADAAPLVEAAQGVAAGIILAVDHLVGGLARGGEADGPGIGAARAGHEVAQAEIIGPRETGHAPQLLIRRQAIDRDLGLEGRAEGGIAAALFDVGARLEHGGQDRLRQVGLGHGGGGRQPGQGRGGGHGRGWLGPASRQGGGRADAALTLVDPQQGGGDALGRQGDGIGLVQVEVEAARLGQGVDDPRAGVSHHAQAILRPIDRKVRQGEAPTVDAQAQRPGLGHAIEQTGGDLGPGGGAGLHRHPDPAAGSAVQRRAEGGAGVAVVADDQPVAELARFGVHGRLAGRAGNRGFRRRGCLCLILLLTSSEGQYGGRGEQQGAEHHEWRFQRQKRDAMNGQAEIGFKPHRGFLRRYADRAAQPLRPRARLAIPPARYSFPELETEAEHGQDQGRQSHRGHRRRRNDPDHLAVDQGQADLPVS
uniref:Integral membrane protein n=1 Tax=Parastrongyloides trichosuri TaxID=131310 RepID=A0A0N5A604_PARTI